MISDALTAVRDGVWSGVTAVARSVSRSFSTGPSHARYERMEEDERKKKTWEYQKLQWMESMERNLCLLKQIIDHRRNELHIVDMGNDLEKKRALETELRDLKVRQARLSCALWVQPEDLPSSQTLLEMKNPKKLQAELEAKLVQLGLIEAKSKPPLPSSPVDAQAAPKAAPKLLLRPSSDRGRGSPETRSPSDSPAPQVQGARPQTPRRRAEMEGEGQGATGQGPGKGPAKGPAKGPGKGVPAWAKGAAKGPQKGPDWRSDEAGKGGKKGGPPAKGGRIRKVTPLGRRFHWKELNAEKVKGTVFDKGESPMDTIDVQFDGLKNYFADDDELSKQGGPARQKSQETITVFDNTRMQNIAIVLRGVFGQMPSVQEPQQQAKRW